MITSPRKLMIDFQIFFLISSETFLNPEENHTIIFTIQAWEAFFYNSILGRVFRKTNISFIVICQVTPSGNINLSAYISLLGLTEEQVRAAVFTLPETNYGKDCPIAAAQMTSANQGSRRHEVSQKLTLNELKQNVKQNQLQQSQSFPSAHQ